MNKGKMYTAVGALGVTTVLTLWELVGRRKEKQLVTGAKLNPIDQVKASDLQLPWYVSHRPLTLTGSVVNKLSSVSLKTCGVVATTCLVMTGSCYFGRNCLKKVRLARTTA